MLKFKIIIASLGLTLGSYGQNLIKDSEPILQWGKSNTQMQTLTLDYKAKISPSILLVGYDNPNGMKFQVSFKEPSVAVNLQYVIDLKKVTNEFMDINEGYYVEVSLHDFDGDKNPEIIIVVGDGLVDLVANVVKYHPPTARTDAGRIENWSLLGTFYGQEFIRIINTKIVLPIGSQGLYDEYNFIENKFVKTN